MKPERRVRGGGGGGREGGGGCVCQVGRERGWS
jgi:hypothetical protein